MKLNKKNFQIQRISDSSKFNIIYNLKNFITPSRTGGDQATDEEKIIHEMIISFLLCNNVTPIEEESGRMLQAASPDEVCLVQFAESLGYTMKHRNLEKITLQDPVGNERVFKILKNFPFSSARKVRFRNYLSI